MAKPDDGRQHCQGTGIPTLARFERQALRYEYHELTIDFLSKLIFDDSLHEEQV